MEESYTSIKRSRLRITIHLILTKNIQGPFYDLGLVFIENIINSALECLLEPSKKKEVGHLHCVVAARNRRFGQTGACGTPHPSSHADRKFREQFGAFGRGFC